MSFGPDSEHAAPADGAEPAHAALRRLVAQRAGVAADTVEIQHDRAGRPIVLDHRLHVTLSRSGELAACAVSNRHVGVDVERADRVEADDALAARICSPREGERLAALVDEVDRQRALIVLWTRKEAVAKVLGVGLKIPFNQLDVADDVPLIGGRHERSLWVRNIEAEPLDYLLAVAGEGRVRPTVRPRVMLNRAPAPDDPQAIDRPLSF